MGIKNHLHFLHVKSDLVDLKTLQNPKHEKVIHLSNNFYVFNPEEGFEQPKHVDSANLLTYH